MTLAVDIEHGLGSFRLEARFDELFKQTPDGYVPAWIHPGREVLITWEPRHS